MPAILVVVTVLSRLSGSPQSRVTPCISDVAG